MNQRHGGDDDGPGEQIAGLALVENFVGLPGDWNRPLRHPRNRLNSRHSPDFDRLRWPDHSWKTTGRQNSANCR